MVWVHILPLGVSSALRLLRLISGRCISKQQPQLERESFSLFDELLRPGQRKAGNCSLLTLTWAIRIGFNLSRVKVRKFGWLIGCLTRVERIRGKCLLYSHWFSHESDVRHIRCPKESSTSVSRSAHVLELANSKRRFTSIDLRRTHTRSEAS